MTASVQEVERPLISICLAATRGNQIRAAQLLGLNRNTLRKKIRDLGLEVIRGLRPDRRTAQPARTATVSRRRAACEGWRATAHSRTRRRSAKRFAHDRRATAEARQSWRRNRPTFALRHPQLADLHDLPGPTLC